MEIPFSQDVQVYSCPNETEENGILFAGGGDYLTFNIHRKNNMERVNAVFKNFSSF